MKKFFKKVILVLFALIGFVLVSNFHSESAYAMHYKVHYIKKYQLPQPFEVKQKYNYSKIILRTSNLKVKKHFDVYESMFDYYYTAKAKIGGHIYYRMVKVGSNYKNVQYLGWISSGYIWNKPVYYDSSTFIPYISEYPTNISNADPWPRLNGIVKSVPNKDALVTNAFKWVFEVDYDLPSYGDYSMGWTFIRASKNQLFVSIGGRKNTSRDFFIKPHETRKINIYDRKMKLQRASISYDKNGHWITFKYIVNGKQHVQTISNQGFITYDGKTVKYMIDIA